MNERNRQKRLEFAQNHFFKDNNFWKDVIFCDESKFNVFGTDGLVRVWRKPNREFDVANLKSTIKHGGGSVMVWGCISAAGVGELVFIDTTMNAIMYRNILRENLKKSAAKMGIENSFKFYQDNDPKHRSYLVREWLLYNCAKVLDTPSQSLDLNPIENVWDELDRRVRKTPVTSKTELRQRLQEEWSRIPVDYLQKIIFSMPRRLQCVLDQHGYPTKY